MTDNRQTGKSMCTIVCTLATPNRVMPKTSPLNVITSDGKMREKIWIDGKVRRRGEEIREAIGKRIEERDGDGDGKMA